MKATKVEAWVEAEADPSKAKSFIPGSIDRELGEKGTNAESGLNR